MNIWRRLIRFARITGADGEKQLPVQQISYNGKVSNALIIMPYGLDANLSADSLGAMLTLDGNEENKAFIGGDLKNRLGGLEQNEVALYHPKTKTFIKLNNENGIEIDTAANNGEVKINTGTGPVTLIADNVDAKIASFVQFDCPASLFTGNLTVEGDFVNTGSASFTTDIFSNSKNIGDLHFHKDTQPNTGTNSGPVGP